MLSRPFPHGLGGMPLVCPSGTITNPGTSSAKEHEYSVRLHLARLSGVRMQRVQFNTKTTLGNGYLGSRIDEERSEMRYLV